MTRFILLSAFVFIFPLCQWLGDDPAHRARVSEPRVVADVMLYRREWYDKTGSIEKPIKTGPRTWRFETVGHYLIKHDWRAANITVYTFYSDGHCTVSKGE